MQRDQDHLERVGKRGGSPELEEAGQAACELEREVDRAEWPRRDRVKPSALHLRQRSGGAATGRVLSTSGGDSPELCQV